jgi:hypothetical protein
MRTISLSLVEGKDGGVGKSWNLLFPIKRTENGNNLSLSLRENNFSPFLLGEMKITSLLLNEGKDWRVGKSGDLLFLDRRRPGNGESLSPPLEENNPLLCFLGGNGNNLPSF